MDDQKWTPKLVAKRMGEAARTLRRLPKVLPAGYISFWPSVIHDPRDAYGLNDVELQLGPPTAEEISRMDAALQWLHWLEPDQARLVWLSAENVPRKLIMRKMNVSRSTIWRLLATSLAIISTRLNIDSGKADRESIHGRSQCN
ncbi:MAG: hypothetical protein HQL65_19905 [Magnetococcales bacterium]|nr:hypothetical protein [Magnetococcales bacterium]